MASTISPMAASARVISAAEFCICCRTSSAAAPLVSAWDASMARAAVLSCRSAAWLVERSARASLLAAIWSDARVRLPAVSRTVVVICSRGRAMWTSRSAGASMAWPSMASWATTPLAFVFVPTTSGTGAEASRVAVIVAAVLIILRRIALPEVRIITKPYDFLVLAIAVAPFLTGFLAYHQVGSYDFWIVAHVLAGELMLVAIPFTKLSHFLLFFLSRAQLGMDYGIKRGGMKNKGMAW